MISNSFLFYDLETSGLSKSFDQILQFAAIRTDLELNEIERYDISVKLRPDIIPAPGATITHRIGVYDTEGGLCEVDAARNIHALMNKPGTISIGYNTLGFDDEFLRFTFFRNLLDPYTHQYANGCSRMDLLPFSVIYYLYKNEVLKWPKLNGRPSMKLELISSMNSLAEGQAHDAMVDVEATLGLAKAFIKERKMWDYLSGYFSKNEDGRRIQELPVSFQSASGLHLSGIMAGAKFGPDLSYQIPVIYIGDSIPYKGQGLWLRLDHDDLSDTTEDTISETTWVIRKKKGEPHIILPPAPRFLKTMHKETLVTAKKNSDWLKANSEIFRKIVAYHRKFKYPEIEGVDADGSIYINGFLSSGDKKLCAKFHQADIDGKKEIKDMLKDNVTKELAKRVIARNFTEKSELDDKLGELKASVYNGTIDEKIIDFRGDHKLQAEEALIEIKSLRNRNGLEDDQVALLDELEAYIEEKKTEFS